MVGIQVMFFFRILGRGQSHDPVVQRDIEEKQGLDHRVELVKV